MLNTVDMVAAVVVPGDDEVVRVVDARPIPTEGFESSSLSGPECIHKMRSRCECESVLRDSSEIIDVEHIGLNSQSQRDGHGVE